MSHKEKLKNYSRLILDEGTGKPSLAAFTQYASKLGATFEHLIEITKTDPGIPDDLLIAKYLDEHSVLLTTDRPFHNKVLRMGLGSFFIRPDLSLSGKPLKSIETKAAQPVNNNMDLDSITYTPPPSRLRTHTCSTNERTLKKLRTKRRRIRNHFGGFHNLDSVAITLSTQGRLIGFKIKISGNTDQKALDASESYLQASTKNTSAPFSFALMYALQLQLNDLRTVLYYDSPALPNPATLDDPFFLALKKEFNTLTFLETPKGPFIEGLRRKLSGLVRRPNNEIVVSNFAELRARALEMPLEQSTDESANESIIDRAYTVDANTDRGCLLLAAATFIKKVRTFDDILQVALIGSLATEKLNPKDLDLMITVTPKTDLKRLAKLGRQTLGQIQRGLLGVDIFLVQDEEYIGRTCTFRDPSPRMACNIKLLKCDFNRLHLCDTSQNFALNKETVANPPIILFPTFSARVPVPMDVQHILGDLKPGMGGVDLNR